MMMPDSSIACHTKCSPRPVTLSMNLKLAAILHSNNLHLLDGQVFISIVAKTVPAYARLPNHALAMQAKAAARAGRRFQVSRSGSAEAAGDKLWHRRDSQCSGTGVGTAATST